MPELDPNNLGTLVASAANAKRYKVYLVEAGAGVTAEKLQQNPNYAGEGVIASSDAADAGGTASVNLAPMKADLERKLQNLPKGSQVASFVVGFGADAADVKAIAGPTFSVKGAPADAGGELNEYVLRAIQAIPKGGAYKWVAGWDGTTKNISYCGKTVAAGDRNHTFCCGVSFEAFNDAVKLYYQEKGKPAEIPGISADKMLDLRGYFYINKSRYPGAAAGFPALGIGREVSAEEAKGGDFAQIWRGTPGAEGVSGHSVVFLSWEVTGKGGKGIHYWSSQPSGGIAEHTETVQSGWKITFGRCILPAG